MAQKNLIKEKKIIRQAISKYKQPDKYGQWLGYKVEKINPKKAEGIVSIQLREDHLSLAGNIHGGVISGFFDSACAVAVFSVLDKTEFCSTVELKVNYFKPLHAGDFLISKAKVVFRGNRLCVVHAFLYRTKTKSAKKSSEPVAMATATFNIVKMKT